MTYDEIVSMIRDLKRPPPRGDKPRLIVCVPYLLYEPVQAIAKEYGDVLVIKNDFLPPDTALCINPAALEFP